MTQVAILDHHQSIQDGYQYRLKDAKDIEIVATMYYGEEVEPALAKKHVDVLILAINVPTAPDNNNPYPILYLTSKICQRFQDLNILVISMNKQSALINAVLAAGVNGYILKNDHVAIKNLVEIIRSVANGGHYFSDGINQLRIPRKYPDFNLTPRQKEALSVSSAYPGATTTELAQRLDIADSTMRNLLSKTYRHLGVPNRAAAIAKAHQIGLIPTINLSPG